MTATDALRGVTRLFLDTAPVIYHVESHPTYRARAASVFSLIDAGVVPAVTSPVTLAECLAGPCKRGLHALVTDFIDAIVRGAHTEFVPIDAAMAEAAARLRAAHGITLSDALQFAAAREARCHALLTNDLALRRVPGVRVIVLDDLT